MAAILSATGAIVLLPVATNVATDVPARRIPDLAAEVQDADLGDLEQVVLSPPEFVVVEADTAATGTMSGRQRRWRSLLTTPEGEVAASRPSRSPDQRPWPASSRP